MAIPKAKKKKVSRARSRTGLNGIPNTDNFLVVREYVQYELDPKEVAGVLRSFIRDEYKSESKTLLSAPDYMYHSYRHVATSIIWHKQNKQFPLNWDHDRCVANYIAELKKVAEKRIMEKEAVAASPRATLSPAEIIAQKGDDFLGMVDEKIDEFLEEFKSDFSVYNEMLKENHPPQIAKRIVEHFTSLKNELEELVNEKTPDLVEGYGWMKVPERKKFLEFVTNLINDSKKYLLKKKAQRAPIKPRVKTADKQVEKMKYLKESSEYKISSISPTTVVGAQRLYAFNTKYRKIFEYISSSSKGFEVKGTTLQNVDFEESRSYTLRKPEQLLSVIQTRSMRDIAKEIDSLTTKPQKPNGRINEETLLIRVHDK